MSHIVEYKQLNSPMYSIVKAISMIYPHKNNSMKESLVAMYITKTDEIFSMKFFKKKIVEPSIRSVRERDENEYEIVLSIVSNKLFDEFVLDEN